MSVLLCVRHLLPERLESMASLNLGPKPQTIGMSRLPVACVSPCMSASTGATYFHHGMGFRV